jgi:hypothetical protein
VFSFHDGASDGFPGGLGSFCPDSPETRAILRDHEMDGFDADSHDTCLMPPAGEIFVFWSPSGNPLLDTPAGGYRPMPSCTSGCGYDSD